VDDRCFQLFDSFPKVRSLDFNTDLRQVRFENTSSAGIGLTGRKGDPGNLSRAIKQACATLHRFIRGEVQEVIENSTPDRGLTRTQLTYLTEKLKIRNVFGEAFQYILLEGLSAQPLMEYFSTNETFFHIGQDPRHSVPDLIQRMLHKARNLLGIDWQAFDANTEDWEIEDAFALLRRMLIFPNEESEAAFWFSMILFINRKIAGPFGHLWFKHRGVPSGSYFTVLIDAIVNLQRTLYLFHKVYNKFPDDIATQGDDGLLCTNEAVTPEALSLAIPANAPWCLRPEKCKFGQSGASVDFLSRTLIGGDQARDINRVERLAIYPEYEVPSGKISAYRARSLWEDCNYGSEILGFAASYLERTYGIPSPEEVPKWTLKFYEKIKWN
jgi:hypothetical protein